MDALVTTEWLAAHCGDEDLRILDASYYLPEHGRDAAAEFATAHIPGARFLDLATLADPDSDLPSMVPPSEVFARRMEALGVRDGDRVVVYDASPLRTAARAWWLLRLFGIAEVAILDGGLGKWKAEARPIETGDAAAAEGQFTPVLDTSGIRTLGHMKTNLETRAEQVVDARSTARFTGEMPETRPRLEAGHIPGSVNIPYASFFNPDGSWKHPTSLRAAFEDEGVELEHPIVATCGSGITAAVIVFAAHLLGRRAALYDGSWTEWGGDPATPKAKGAA